MSPPLRKKQAPAKLDRVSVDAAQHQASARLMDSLLHDVRNPLNALAINLDVLAEKIKAANGGRIPPTHEKNVNVMRDQIFRVDAVLRQFAEFLAPRTDPAGEIDLSDVVQRALDLLQYEARRNQVRLSGAIDRGILINFPGDDARTIALVATLRGLMRAHEGEEVAVTLTQAGADARLEVKDGRHGAAEPLPDAVAALEELAEGVEVGPDGCTLTISGVEVERGANQ